MDAVTPKTGRSADQHSHVVRPAAMEWQKTRFPGCEVKPLLFDRETGLVTALMRFAPGAVLPDHEHVKIEQTFVLEGKLVDKEGPAAGLEVDGRRVRLARAGQPARRLDSRGRADAGDVPDPQQVLRARRPRHRCQRPGLGEPLGPGAEGLSGRLDSAARHEARAAATRCRTKRRCRLRVGLAPARRPRAPALPRHRQSGRALLGLRAPGARNGPRGRGETVDARDLKSLGGNSVPVQIRPSAPVISITQTLNENSRKSVFLFVSALGPQDAR